MKILLVTHGFYPESLGGTEIYSHDLAHALNRRDEHQVAVLARESDPHREEYEVRLETRGGLPLYFINNTLRQCPSFEQTYRNTQLCAVASRLLDQIRPDVVHFQHLTCLSSDLLLELEQRVVPTFFTLNDYWLICQRGQLLDMDLQRCQGASAAGYPRKCQRCAGLAATVDPHGYLLAHSLSRALPALFKPPLRRLAEQQKPSDSASHVMEERYQQLGRALRSVRLFIAPSQTMRRHFMSFGIAPQRLTCLEQGIDLAPFAGLTRHRSSTLRIGFMGSLMASKAPHLLLQAFAGLPPGVATLDLYGDIVDYHGDRSYGQTLQPLLEGPGVRHHGALPHEEMPRALAQLDLLCVPSIWIENAPFVIREAFAAGLPVLASDIGGMAEMVTHEINGLLFQAGSAADLRRCIMRLIESPPLLDTLRDGIPKIMSMEEDVDQLLDLYQRGSALDTNDHPPSSKAHQRPSISERRPRCAAVIVNYRTPEDTLLACWSLRSSERAVDQMIIVDNGSGDHSETYLRSSLPQAQLIEAGENLGYAGGCNLGVAAALSQGADYIFILSSDTLVTANTLGKLEHALESEPRAGICGPLVLARSDPAHTASFGIGFSGRTGRMRHQESGQPYDPQGVKGLRTVAAIDGCAMLIRRQVFEQIGLFDEDYFFYFEDIDFCLRAAASGYRSMVTGEALAYHEGGRTIGAHSPRRLYFAARNHLRAAHRNHPLGPVWGLLRGANIVGLNAAYALTSPDVSTLAGIQAVARGTWDHVRGRTGNQGSR